MFLIGFICGVALLMLLVVLCDDGEDRLYEDEAASIEWHEAQTKQDWQQTRNFLYYDGTEMPLKKKEDLYE